MPQVGVTGGSNAKPVTNDTLMNNQLTGNDNYGRPRRKYCEKMAKLTEEELMTETKHKIWLSAYASNNPRSDYHWHVTACYQEWVRRGQPEKYQEAYDETVENA